MLTMSHSADRVPALCAWWHGSHIAPSIIFHSVQTIDLNEWSSKWTYRNHWPGDKCRFWMGWSEAEQANETDANEKNLSAIMCWSELSPFLFLFFAHSSVCFGRKFLFCKWHWALGQAVRYVHNRLTSAALAWQTHRDILLWLCSLNRFRGRMRSICTHLLHTEWGSLFLYRQPPLFLVRRLGKHVPLSVDDSYIDIHFRWYVCHLTFWMQPTRKEKKKRTEKNLPIKLSSCSPSSSSNEAGALLLSPEPLLEFIAFASLLNGQMCTQDVNGKSPSSPNKKRVCERAIETCCLV